MTNILLPMDQYISRKDIVEKGSDLWVPSSSLGGLLSSLIENTSLSTMEEMENGEEQKFLFPQEVSGMAYCNGAWRIQREKRILKGEFWQHNNTMKILVS